MRNSAIAAGIALAIAALFALSQSWAEDPIKHEGKCFMNTNNGNYAWTDCPKETGPRAAAAKATGKKAPAKAAPKEPAQPH